MKAGNGVVRTMAGVFEVVDEVVVRGGGTHELKKWGMGEREDVRKQEASVWERGGLMLLDSSTLSHGLQPSLGRIIRSVVLLWNLGLAGVLLLLASATTVMVLATG